MDEQLISFLVFSSLFLILTLLTFSLHYIRFIFNRSIFLAFIVSLWFITYYLGHFNLSITIDVLESLQLNFRYSTVFYTFIFAGIILVYITEGASEARNLIYVSITSQLFILLMQIFIYYFASALIPTIFQDVVEPLFRPSYLRALGSIFAAVIALFSALIIYQYLENKFAAQPKLVFIIISLIIAMLVDTALFLGITRFDSFGQRFLSYFLIKSVIILILSVPLHLYLKYFQNKHKIKANKGTLDIFKKIDSLEQELAIKNEELEEYNRDLKIKIDERTKEIQDKQRKTELELSMASEVQRALLPKMEKLSYIRHSVLYLPRSIVSGDLYDFAFIGDKLLYLFIADISGHGIPAILAWSMCKMTISRINFRKYRHRPAEIIQKLSDEVIESKMQHYLSAFICFIDIEEHTIEYVNAGHVPPILISHMRQKHTALKPNSGLVGIPYKQPFVQSKLRYNSSMRMILYTDCLTEARKYDAGEEFGIENLKDSARKNLSYHPAKFHTELLNDLRGYTNTENLSDDLTMITVDLPVR